MPLYDDHYYTRDEYILDQRIKYACSGEMEWCDIHDQKLCEHVERETGDVCPYCAEEK